jgi:hypothetical protein
MKKQNCMHEHFYTMGDDNAYCNNCHEYLGKFDPWNSPFGFIKKTKDKIKNEYLNEQIAKRNK